MTQFLQKSGLVALLLSGFIAACGSTETTSDKDLTKEALLGTKPDGSDSKVYGSYSIVFNESARTLSANVDLKLGGSTGNGIKISEPNKIQLNGENLQFHDTSNSALKIVTSWYFLKKSLQAPAQNYVFTWFQDGKEFTNSLVFALGVSNSVAQNASIPNNADFKFSFVGPDLLAKERMTADIVSQEEFLAETSSILSTSITSGHEFIFTSQEIAKFRKGKADISLSRFAEGSVQQGHGAGGIVSSKFEASPTRVVFAP